MLRKIVVVAVALAGIRAEAAQWSKQTKDTFTGSCVAAATGNGTPDEAAKSYCGCVAGQLEKKYTEKQFMAASTKQTPEVQADVQGAIKSCARQLVPAAKPGQVGWSDMFKGAFVGSCVDSAVEKGAQKAKAEGYCACVSKSLEKTYTEDEFTKASFNPSQKYNDDVIGAAKGCVRFLQP